MLTRDELFSKQTSGAKWDVAVAIKRGNPLPLDNSSIFKTYEDAAEYAANSPIAYPTQIVAVLNEDGTNEYYGITQSGTLESIGGSSVDVDNLSVMLNGSKLSLKNFGTQYYKHVNVLASVTSVDDLDATAETGSYCKVDDVWYVKDVSSWVLADNYPKNDDPYILVEGFTYGLEPKVIQVTDLDGDDKFEVAWYEKVSYSKEEVDAMMQEIHTKLDDSSSWGDSF